MNSFAINAAVRNPGNVNSSAGYAYFPGTGPTLKACGDCAFAVKVGKHATCRKWSDLKRSAKAGPPISLNSESCKYFNQKGN